MSLAADLIGQRSRRDVIGCLSVSRDFTGFEDCKKLFLPLICQTGKSIMIIITIFLFLMKELVLDPQNCSVKQRKPRFTLPNNLLFF